MEPRNPIAHTTILNRPMIKPPRFDNQNFFPKYTFCEHTFFNWTSLEREIPKLNDES